RLASVTTVGSAIDYKKGGSHFGRLRRAMSLLRLLHAAPFGTFARAYAPFARDRFVDDFMYAPEMLEPLMRRAIWASAFTWISGRVLLELSTTFEPRGFRGRDGVLWERELPKIALPLLVVAGSRDLQCPPLAARATFDAVRVLDKRFVLAEGLGHFDLLLSRKAEREVFPAISSFLERS
ncbi:hypothetical protein HY251_01710, partial [bacterium]|nr:hypothetical protein [bacterium]